MEELLISVHIHTQNERRIWCLAPGSSPIADHVAIEIISLTFYRTEQGVRFQYGRWVDGDHHGDRITIPVSCQFTKEFLSNSYLFANFLKVIRCFRLSGEPANTPILEDANRVDVCTCKDIILDIPHAATKERKLCSKFCSSCKHPNATLLVHYFILTSI